MEVVREVGVDDEAEERAQCDQYDGLPLDAPFSPEDDRRPHEARHDEQREHVVGEREDEREREEPPVLALEEEVQPRDEQDYRDAHRLPHVHAVEEGGGASGDGDEPDAEPQRDESATRHARELITTGISA